MQTEFFELQISLPVDRLEEAEAVAHMATPYGIYVEDYSDLEAGAREIAHIDLIDEDLLRKDRNQAIIHIYLEEDANPAEALAYLQARYAALGIPADFSTGTVREADWADNWKRFFKTTPVGKRLLIHPSWEPLENVSDRVVLSIDPGAAFGTGTHATTRCCLALLEQVVTPGCRMLDVGCGSGILSIGALLLGAGEATGIDIDPLAVKVAGENARINGVARRAAFLQGDLAGQATGKYDVICANIVADVILDLAPDVPRLLTSGGRFLCSGIIDLRAEEVADRLARYGLQITDRMEEDHWVAYAATYRL